MKTKRPVLELLYYSIYRGDFSNKENFFMVFCVLRQFMRAHAPLGEPRMRHSVNRARATRLLPRKTRTNFGGAYCEADFKI
jgi:hypothetical protein